MFVFQISKFEKMSKIKTTHSTLVLGHSKSASFPRNIMLL